VAWQHLISRRDGAVERLTLNRPDVRNAFNDTLIAELTEWAETIAADRSIRAVVISGAGPSFCAGADISWMSKTIEYSEQDNVADALRASAMFAAIDTLPFPVVGRVHGAALGGGAGLAAVCDIVVCEEHAIFGFTEVKLGIIPAVISPFVLAKIGRSAARELFLTGRRFSAAHALDVGLVHTVVPAGELDRAVDGVTREVLAAGPEAVAAVKQLIADVWSAPSLDEARTHTASALAARRVSAEGQDGLRAFLEKRKPRWSRE
jgi:methylglutaconyl-CoA hydratase